MNNASEHRTCPNCGATIPAKAPQGICPKCLMAAAAVSTEAGQTAGKRPEPPSLERLAAAFPQLEVIEFIGQGGMGAVYKARQKQLDRIVALKVLPPGISGDPAFAERFTREAKALAKLLHPNIVALFEFGQADGIYYLLMEYVDGVSLGQLLRSSRVSAREALAIVPQICDALQYAHDQGIVHRDIKPENILLDRRGRVKVADFGLAKLVGTGAGAAGSLLPAASPQMDDGAHEVTRPTDTLTDAGKIMGTPNYMAPEQAEHPDEVDHRADIYALGVVFYQMLTGELPGKSLEPPSSRMRGMQIDVRLDEVVLHALEKKPERRYQQVSEVKTMVETIASTSAMRGDHVVHSEETRTDNTAADHVHYRRPGALLIAAGLFIVAGLVSAWRVGSSHAQGTFSLDCGMLCIAVGIGLLRLRPWWRKTAIALLLFSFALVFVAGGLALSGLPISGANLIFLGEDLSDSLGPVGIFVGLVVSLVVLWRVYAVLIRPEVKALFEKRGFSRPAIEWIALLGALVSSIALSHLLHNTPGTVELRVTDFTRTSNAVLRMAVTLTNSTPLTLNVVDDADGKPAFILDDGSPPGMWLTYMVNHLKINLAPGASLTNTVFLTNPPPRFRLKLQMRDLADEGRGWPLPVGRLLPEPWRSKFVEWDLKRHKRWDPASGWILPELSNGMQPPQFQ